MPDTLTTPDVTNLAAHEFDIPCDAADNCDQPAAWYVWLSHTMAGCGHTSPVCNRHKVLVDKLWKQELALAPGICPRCGVLISPNIGDNVKWVPLKGNRYA
jgi:hypothetical protein